jgi:hypothetical protein
MLYNLGEELCKKRETASVLMSEIGLKVHTLNRRRDSPILVAKTKYGPWAITFTHTIKEWSSGEETRM